jgi:hypothetical protein
MSLSILFILFTINSVFALNDSSIKQTREDRLQSDNLANRKLWGVCEDGSQPIVHYFEVDVQIQPSDDVTGICTLADQMKLGSDINAILSSYVSYKFLWIFSLSNLMTFIRLSGTAELIKLLPLKLQYALFLLSHPDDLYSLLHTYGEGEEVSMDVFVNAMMLGEIFSIRFGELQNGLITFTLQN